MQNVGYHSDNSVLSQMNYAYDSENRVDSITDLHNGLTDYVYYVDGQIKSVTSPDPDTSQSGTGYDAQTTSYDYTDGAVSISRVTTLPNSTTQTELFLPTGELEEVSGSQTYPVSYQYDHSGRRLGQTTWQDKAGSSGAVVLWFSASLICRK